MEFGSFGFLRRWEIRSTRKKNMRAMDTTNKSSEYYGHLFPFAVRVHLLEGSFSVECATLTNMTSPKLCVKLQHQLKKTWRPQRIIWLQRPGRWKLCKWLLQIYITITFTTAHLGNSARNRLGTLDWNGSYVFFAENISIVVWFDFLVELSPEVNQNGGEFRFATKTMASYDIASKRGVWFSNDYI